MLSRVFVLTFLFLFHAATAVRPNHSRGYRYIMGTAVEECPEGTHAYGSNPMGPTWSVRTCTSPVAYDMGGICDMSRCDCDEPTVLNESTGKCVNLEDCPPNTPAVTHCLRSQ